MTTLPNLLHCRSCSTVFPRLQGKAHAVICSGGPELQFPATRDQVAAYGAALLAESVEQERIAAGPVPSPRRR